MSGRVILVLASRVVASSPEDVADAADAEANCTQLMASSTGTVYAKSWRAGVVVADLEAVLRARGVIETS